jgi:hypothetical protein
VGFTVHTGAEGFWARRARTSVDVLGPGVLVGRVAGFGVSKEQAAADLLRIGSSEGRQHQNEVFHLLCNLLYKFSLLCKWLCKSLIYLLKNGSEYARLI